LLIPIVGSLALTLIGMAWLGRVSANSAYATGVALPMILIGIGQVGALAPLTAAGVSRVAPEAAGAASGLVNVAHQLGSSLGVAFLVVIFAAAGAGPVDLRELLAHRVSIAPTAGAGMLLFALALVMALIVRPLK